MNKLNGIRDLLNDYASRQSNNYVESPITPSQESSKLDPLEMQQAKEFIKNQEGSRSKIYDDLNPNAQIDLAQAQQGDIQGTPTVGYGRALSPEEIAQGSISLGKKNIPLDQPVSPGDQEALLSDKIQQQNKELGNKFNMDILNPNQKTALLSRAYNLGPTGAAGKDTQFGQLLNAATKDPANAQTYLNKLPEHMNEIKAGGEIQEGLIKRRLDEAAKSSEPISSLADANKQDRAIIDARSEQNPNPEQFYNPPKFPEALEPSPSSDSVLLRQSGMNKSKGDNEESRNIKETIAEYKKYLEESDKQGKADASQLQNAQWMDAISGIGRTLAQHGRNPNPVIPDQTNFAKQYLDRIESQRQGSKIGLQGRENLLDLYAKLARVRRGAVDEITPHQQAMLDLRNKEAVQRQMRFDAGMSDKEDARLEKQKENLSKRLDGPQMLARGLEGIEGNLGFKIDDAKFSKSGDLLVDGKKKDLPGVNIPGLGRISGFSSDARQLQGSMDKLFNQTLQDRSGKAVTSQELERLKKEFQQGKYNSEPEMVRALQAYKTEVGRMFQDKSAGFNKKAVEAYKKDEGHVGFEQPKTPSKPKTVVQNGHTYTLNESTGEYE